MDSGLSIILIGNLFFCFESLEIVLLVPGFTRQKLNLPKKNAILLATSSPTRARLRGCGDRNFGVIL
jgi:hypothetical protein